MQCWEQCYNYDGLSHVMQQIHVREHEGANKNGQSRETGSHLVHMIEDEDKQDKKI